MTKNTLQNNINELYNYHFEKHYYKNRKPFGSIVRMRGLGINPTPEQADLGNHFKMIKRKYSVSMEFSTKEDFIQEYSILFIRACYQLEVLESLETLLSQPDIYKSRLSFIKSYITREFHEVANPKTLVIPTKDGRKYVDIEISSLDVVVNNEDSKEALINIISEDASLYVVKDSSYNHFIEWVLDNHEKILTKKQDAVFTKLLSSYQPLVDRSTQTLEARNAMLEEVKSTNDKLKHMFRNIKSRCLKKYNEEFGGIMYSNASVKSQELHKTLNEYVTQANFKHWENAEARQMKLTKMIKNNYDNEEFEVIIVKGLKTEEVIDIVRGVKDKQLISNKTLRKVRQNIDKYLSVYAPLIIEASYPEYEYKENLFSGVNKAPVTHLKLSASGSLSYMDEKGISKQL